MISKLGRIVKSDETSLRAWNGAINLKRILRTSPFLGFAFFLLVRLFVWRYRYRVFLDAYAYYLPAGIFYIKGGLPRIGIWQTNPEHPLLAKYIIGFFAVYFHNAQLSSLLFAFLSAVLVYLISRHVVDTSVWSALPVFLLSIDGINVNLSLDPMPDIFMLFFGLLGIYLLFQGHRKWKFTATGISFGLAVACKWNGALFLLAAVIWLMASRKFKPVALILVLATAAYALSYAPFILSRGFIDFISLQGWMLNYLTQKQVGMFGMITALNRIFGPYFFISTLNPLYVPFVKIGPYFVSVDNAVDPVTALLPYPILYLQLRRGTRNKSLQLILLTTGLYVGLHMFALDPFESWLFAPVTALTTILTANLILEYVTGRRSYLVSSLPNRKSAVLLRTKRDFHS